jgi:ectoine hydrolase
LTDVDLNLILDVLEAVEEGPADLSHRVAADLEFPVSEYARRIGRLRAGMAELEIDALVLAQPANVRYFTGLQTWLWKPLIPTVAVLTREIEKSTLLGPIMDRDGFMSTTWIPEVAVYGGDDHPGDALAGLLKQLGLEDKRVGFELGRSQLTYLTPEVLQRVTAQTPGIEVCDAVPICSAVRMLKSDEEISRLQKAAALTAIGFERGFDAARPGSSERELAAIAAEAMIAEGSLPGFAPMTMICRVSPDTYARNLQFPGDQTVTAGAQIFFDGGCEWRGYQTDIIRSGVIGRLPHAAEDHFGMLDEAIEVATRSLDPGTPLGEAHRAVREFASVNGLESAEQPFGIGHGIGLDRWELPMVTDRPPDSKVTAREGMVLSLEPSFGSPDGLSGEGMFLMEDEVVVRPGGADVLSTQTPRVIRALDRKWPFPAFH